MNQPTEEGRSNPAEEPGHRVLIVDDNAGSAKILGLLFSKLGHEQVELAYSGREALQKAQKFRPDILVLDLELGDVSGLEVARTLRQQPGFIRLLLVALSGNSSSEDQEKSKAAGFDLHLAKPIGVDEVKSILRLFQETDQSGERTADLLSLPLPPAQADKPADLKGKSRQ